MIDVTTDIKASINMLFELSSALSCWGVDIAEATVGAEFSRDDNRTSNGVVAADHINFIRSVSTI